MPKGIPFSGHRKGYQRHSNGQLIRTKPTSRRNANAAWFYVGHGGASDLLKVRIDMRSSLGRRYRRDSQAFIAHIGGCPTIAQAAIIDQAVRVGILRDLAWSEMMRSPSPVKANGKVSPATDLFLKACKQQREVLGLLGLEHKAKDITLDDILTGRVEHETA